MISILSEPMSENYETHDVGQRYESTRSQQSPVKPPEDWNYGRQTRDSGQVMRVYYKVWPSAGIHCVLNQALPPNEMSESIWVWDSLDQPLWNPSAM